MYQEVLALLAGGRKALTLWILKEGTNDGDGDGGQMGFRGCKNTVGTLRRGKGGYSAVGG